MVRVLTLDKKGNSVPYNYERGAVNKFKLWSRLQPFEGTTLDQIPMTEGVYIVHRDNKPITWGTAVICGGD
jgi:hypothetical protein